MPALVRQAVLDGIKGQKAHSGFQRRADNQSRTPYVETTKANLGYGLSNQS